MRFAPSDSEQAMLDDLPPEERFHYATSRIIECEEVWSLGDENGWLIHDHGDEQLIWVWPYRQMAEDCAGDAFSHCTPISVSLEHFLYSLLKHCQNNGILFEVNPVSGKEGYLIPAARLYEVLESMIETGSYFIEG